MFQKKQEKSGLIINLCEISSESFYDRTHDNLSIDEYNAIVKTEHPIQIELFKEEVEKEVDKSIKECGNKFEEHFKFTVDIRRNKFSEKGINSFLNVNNLML